MKTRNGKIARLPPSLQGKVLVAGKERGELEIREQLNARLDDGEPGNRLVEWLNSNPDVMKVMAEQFEGRQLQQKFMSRNTLRPGRKNAGSCPEMESDPQKNTGSCLEIRSEPVEKRTGALCTYLDSP